MAAIVEAELATVPEVCKLIDFRVTSGNNIKPTASVKLVFKKKKLLATSSGDGPIDACFKTIDKAIGVKGKLVDYKVKAVTSGKDALGEASVKVNFKGELVIGRASSTDVIEARALAYVNAINRLSGTAGKTKSSRKGR